MVRRKNQKTSRKVKVNNQVRREVSRQLARKAEMKCFGVEQTEQVLTPATAGYVYQLSTITEGTGPSQRIGTQITRKGCHFKYAIKHMSTVIPAFVRVVLYSSDAGQMNDATDSLLLDINDDPQTLTAGDLQDILGRLNKKQLVAHYDKVHKLQSGLSTTAEGNAPNFLFVNKWLKKVFGKMDYIGSESQRNNLRCLVIVREVDNDTNNPGVEFTLESRLFYTDI